MKNRVKRVVAMMLLTIVGASACTQNTPINSSDSGTLDGSYASVDHGEINIWTMPSSANPIQEADCSQYYTDTPILEIETAKNESEAGQIFFHSTGGVQSYTLEICDLSAGNGNIIKKENIKVYNQYYSNITQLSLLTSGRPLGHYPDALIPQRLSEKVGENKVAADYNQSIYIDIFTDEETPAGTYTGDFKLKIDQEIFTVPVSVRVRNFTLTNINHVQSAFFLFDEYIMGGDLDNTPEQYQEYVDFLLDYRVSTTQPVYYSMTDKELWVEQMKDYAANEKVSSYAIGSTYGVEEEMRLLIENSTPEVNLVKKGFRYLIDEPTQDLLPTYEQKQKELIDLLIAIANSYTDEELQTYGVTREDIVGIEVLVTLTISAVGTMDGLRTYCALTSDFHTEERRARYEEYKMTPYLGANNELEGTDYGTTWWYVCCHPYEPAPNYHIDNDVLDARVMSWMQYDYDIDGIVYWGTASYFNTHTQVDEDNGWENVDPYDNPAGVYPGNATNGDGYLVYPGAKYGEPGPLPSSRLINIRDGFEDYEYLLYLENMMDEYVKKYNVADTIDFDAVMSPIYDTLYTGVHADNDFNRVQEARKTVMDMIEWLSSDSHAIMKINDIDVLKNEVTVDVYAMSGATLTVEGKNIVGVPSGEGLKFSYTQSLKGLNNIFKATLIASNEAKIFMEKTLGSEVKVVDDFNGSNVSKWKESLRGGITDYMNLSLNQDMTYVKNGTNSIRLQIDNGNWTAWEQTNFVSGLTMTKEDFFGTDKLEQIDYIEIHLYNSSEIEFDLSLRLETQKGSAAARSKSFYSVTLKKGWNTIKIPSVSMFKWMSGEEDLLAYLTGVIIEFEKIEEDVDIYLDTIFYTYLK